MVSKAIKDCVIILSGGIDSTTLLYKYAKRIALAISFDYGSNHNAKEIPFARYHCKKLKIKHIVVDLNFMRQYFKSSLLEGDDAIPVGCYDDENMQSTVVPFRNAIMISIATGVAESNDLQFVMMANHGGDHSIYPDCRPEFVNAMNKTMQYGTYKNICLLTPFTNIDKAEIVKMGSKIGIDYSKTWSCYMGKDKHCGQCGTCMERKDAFSANKLQDPTDYII